MLWGIAWTFATGSDVAWATDEIDRPDRMHLLIAAQGRWQMIGSGAGIAAFGALAAIVDRPTAIVGAGAAMLLLLGVWFAAAFPEHNFTRVRTNRLKAALGIARKGARLALGDRTLLMLVWVTVLVNGGTVWFTAVGLAGYATAALALAAVQRRLDSDRGTRLWLVLACLTGLASLTLLGLTPNLALGVAAVLAANGVAMPLVRTVTTIWVNRRTSSDVRATTHSFLAQAESFGEIVCAAVLAGVTGAVGTGSTLVMAGSLFAVSVVLLMLGRYDALLPGEDVEGEAVASGSAVAGHCAASAGVGGCGCGRTGCPTSSHALDNRTPRDEIGRQVFPGVAPAAGAGDVDLAAAQCVLQRHDHAQLVGGPLEDPVLIDGCFQPAVRNHALDRDVLRGVVVPGRVGDVGVSLQQVHGVHHRPTGSVVALELDRGRQLGQHPPVAGGAGTGQHGPHLGLERLGIRSRLGHQRLQRRLPARYRGEHHLPDRALRPAQRRLGDREPPQARAPSGASVRGTRRQDQM
ncbi:hypothetical protein [Nonomuraea sp. NPDC049695]|uniref:hypothetical protein n=1 Tax=Nonomuraea sp. NPDC049695 TaxID=3154734 RepID=UPI003434B565